MQFAEIIEFINNTGFSIVLMAYFLIKDWKFNESIIAMMGEIKEVLSELKAWHTREDLNT